MQQGPISRVEFENTLTAAYEQGGVEQAMLLIDNNNNVEYSNKDKHSKLTAAFIWAAAYGHLDVVKCILQADAKEKATANASISHYLYQLFVTKPEFTPAASNHLAFILAAMKGHYEVVEFLLGDPRVDPTADKNSAIFYTEHPKVLELLVKDPRIELNAKHAAVQNININFNHPEMFIVEYPEILKLFLTSSNITMNSKIQFVLNVPLSIDPHEYYKCILDSNPTIDAAILCNFFIRALQCNHTQSIKLLLNDCRVVSAITAKLPRDAQNNIDISKLMLFTEFQGFNIPEGLVKNIKWLLDNDNSERVILVLEHFPFMLPFVRENLTDFLKTRYNLKSSLISILGTYNPEFRKKFFDLVLKEFFAKMPSVVQVLSEHLPAELVCTICPVIDPLFHIYNNRFLKPKVAIEQAPAPVLLPLFGSMSKPICNSMEEIEEDEKSYIPMWAYSSRM